MLPMTCIIVVDPMIGAAIVILQIVLIFLIAEYVLDHE